MKIMVFTEYGSNYQGIADITLPVIRKYCDKHGYEFRELILEGTGNEYYYKKHEFIRDIFDNNEADYVFYLDCDAIITNHVIPLSSFITYGAIFWITEHIGELNGGAIFVKNSSRGNDINNFILAHRDKFPNEQNVINHYRDVLTYAGMMDILPHPSFNSLDYTQYPELPNIRKREEGHWFEGCFVLHVPALSIEKRIEVLKKAKIIYE